MNRRGDDVISGAMLARNFPENVSEIHRKPQSVSQWPGRYSNQGLSRIEVFGLTARPTCSVNVISLDLRYLFTKPRGVKNQKAVIFKMPL
jgi:hypothetical protein